MKNFLVLLVAILFTSTTVVAQSNTVCVPVISMSGIYNGGKITVENLLKSKEIKFTCISDPAANYEVVSMQLVIVPKKDDAIMFSLYGNTLNEEQMTYLSKVKPDTVLYIEKPQVKTPDGSLILALPGAVISVVD